MNTEEISRKEIEEILTKLDYDELEFFCCNQTKTTTTFYYNGYLDTIYFIQVVVENARNIEIWDCIYDEENYVLVGKAYFVGDKWKVVTI